MQVIDANGFAFNCCRVRGAAVGTADRSGRGRWDRFPVNGRAGVLALARHVDPPGRPVLKASKSMADHNRSTLPSMANPTPTSTPAPRPRRLSLFGPPVGVLEVFAREVAFVYHAPFLALQAAVELGAEFDEPTAAQPSATPAERARLHAMPEEQRMSIPRLMRDQDEDRDARHLRKRA